MEVDISALQELQLNWFAFAKEHNLLELLWTEVGIHTSVRFNKHEQDSWCQEGGTALAAVDVTATKVQSRDANTSGLGRWCWLTFHHANSVQVHVVLAYQPIHSPITCTTSVGQQHCHYLRCQGDPTCSRDGF